MSGKIQSYVFKGIRNLLIEDIQENKLYKMPHLVYVTISDSMAVEFLRGGYGNPKLLTFYGDRDCSLEAQTATMSTDLEQLMQNNKLETKVKAQKVIEKVKISGGKFKLSKTPTPSYNIYVDSVDETTGSKTTLTIGDPTTNVEDFSVTGDVITCHSTIPMIEAVYTVEEEVDTIESKDTTPKTYRATGILVAQEVETKQFYEAQLDLPSFSIQPNKQIQIKNETGAPEPITLNFDLFVDTVKGYPYAIDFKKS